MGEATAWYICRPGYVETARAVGLVAGTAAVRNFEREWPSLGVIELDQQLAEQATGFTMKHELSSLDAIHLAAAILLPEEDLVMATWDIRLHRAARVENLPVFPETVS